MPAMSRFKFPHIEVPSMRVRAMRYFMTIFCFLFTVFGISVITCAALLMNRRLSECQFVSRFYSGVYLLLAAGCLTSFFSLLTCVRTQFSTSPAAYMSLGVVVIIVLVLEILAAIGSHVFCFLAADGELLGEMKSSWKNYEGSAMECVDTVHQTFKCCGVMSPSEWLMQAQNATAVSAYPMSCHCSPASSICHVTNTTTNFTSLVYSQGCHKLFLNDLYETLLIARIVGPLVALVEFMFVLAVIYFLHHIQNHSLVGVYVVRSPAGRETPAAGRETPADSQANGSAWVEMDERPATVDVPSVPQHTSSSNSVSISRDETVMHM